MPTPSAKFNITAKDKTKSAFRTVRKNLNSLSKNVASTKVGLAGLAGVGLFGVAIKRSLELNDALAKTADKLGINTQALAGLHHAGELTGVGQNAMNKGLQNMIRTIRDASNGMAAYSRSYEELGLNVQDLQNMSPEQQFATVAESINKVENNTRKLGIAYDIFGGKGTAILNTLALGKEGLAETAQEAIDLGIAMSRVDAAKIEAANDSIHRSKQAVLGVGNTITVQLAPYITAMSDKFVEAAKSSGGWKEQILGGIESVAMGVAYVGNIIKGLEFAWTGVKLAVAFVAESVLVQLDKMTQPIRGLIELIPGLSDKTKAGFNVLSEAAAKAGERTAKIKADLDNIAREGLPADKVSAFFTEVKAKAEEAGQAVANSRTAMIGGGDGGESTTVIPGSEKLQGELDRLNSSLLSVEERETQSWFKRQEILDNALSNKLLSEENHKALTEKLEASHLKKLSSVKKKGLTDLEKFNAKSWSGQAAHLAGSLMSMTAEAGKHSKTMFKINKAASLVNAVINTYTGVTKSLSAYPYPWNLAMAAGSLAAGMAQVRAIKSQQFGGGGSSGASTIPRAGGGAASVGQASPQTNDVSLPASAQNPNGAQGPAKVIDITLNGAGYSKEGVRELIEQIDEELGDGVKLGVAN